MRISMRVWLFLFFIIAVSLGLLVRPFFLQRDAIRAFRQRDVFIVTQAWYPSLPATKQLFCTPIQTQVLIRPGRMDAIRVLGQELSYEEAHAELQQLKMELQKDVGFSNFALVYDADWPSDRGLQLFKLARSLGVMETPCGIDNFK